jgi:hypothetical protein
MSSQPREITNLPPTTDLELEPVMTTTRLATIANRQRRSRVRDFLFAIGVAAAAIVSTATLETAANAASTHVAQR